MKKWLVGLLFTIMGIFAIWISIASWKGWLFFFSGAPEAEHAPFETIIFGTIWLIAGIWILLERAKSK